MIPYGRIGFHLGSISLSFRGLPLPLRISSGVSLRVKIENIEPRQSRLISLQDLSLGRTFLQD